MKRLLASVMAVALLLSAHVSAIAQSETPEDLGVPASLVTEGELAQWLVRVLGLARFLPAAPTDLECFQVLMQNGIMPKDGWQSNRPVTMGNLARILVLALGKQAEIENPEDDESWIGYLKSEGIDFGTIGEAVENLRPLPQPVGPEAVVTATDPLSKLARINPPDDAQMGADFGTLGRVSDRISDRVIREIELEQVEQIITQPSRPPERPRMTPSAP